MVGLGYVGLPLALLAKSKGHNVTGLDSDPQKIDIIKKSKSPFYDPKISAQLKKSKLNVTLDPAAISKADIIIVCVPTPVDKTFMPDLSLVTSACTTVAKNLTGGQLIIIESTINPSVCDNIIIPLIQEVSGKKCGVGFYLAHCPERISPGDPAWHVGNIARVVGGHDKKSLNKATAFYTSIIDADIKKMASLKEAEAVKIVENSFRDINIAFVNELAISFANLGIDVVSVIDGAATKPFAFMAHYPGAGVGGHCIPVDPYYLIEYAKTNGFTHKFLQTARKINNNMPKYTVDLLISALNESKLPLKGLKVTVLGLSYKANVGDLRHSPSLQIIKLLKARGAKVCVYDPYVSTAIESDIGYKAAISLEEALKEPTAVIVSVAHNIFKKMNPNKLDKLKLKIIIDGRNCLNKPAFIKAGYIYKGIGR